MSKHFFERRPLEPRHHRYYGLYNTCFEDQTFAICPVKVGNTTLAVDRKRRIIRVTNDQGHLTLYRPSNSFTRNPLLQILEENPRPDRWGRKRLTQIRSGSNEDTEKINELVQKVTIAQEMYRSLEAEYLQNARAEGEISSLDGSTSRKFTYAISPRNQSGIVEVDIKVDGCSEYELVEGMFAPGSPATLRVSMPRDKNIQKAILNQIQNNQYKLEILDDFEYPPIATDQPLNNEELTIADVRECNWKALDRTRQERERVKRKIGVSNPESIISSSLEIKRGERIPIEQESYRVPADTVRKAIPIILRYQLEKRHKGNSKKVEENYTKLLSQAQTQFDLLSKNRGDQEWTLRLVNSDTQVSFVAIPPPELDVQMANSTKVWPPTKYCFNMMLATLGEIRRDPLQARKMSRRPLIEAFAGSAQWAVFTALHLHHTPPEIIVADLFPTSQEAAQMTLLLNGFQPKTLPIGEVQRGGIEFILKFILRKGKTFTIGINPPNTPEVIDAELSPGSTQSGKSGAEHVKRALVSFGSALFGSTMFLTVSAKEEYDMLAYSATEMGYMRPSIIHTSMIPAPWINHTGAYREVLRRHLMQQWLHGFAESHRAVLSQEGASTPETLRENIHPQYRIQVKEDAGGETKLYLLEAIPGQSRREFMDHIKQVVDASKGGGKVRIVPVNEEHPEGLVRARLTNSLKEGVEIAIEKIDDISREGLAIVKVEIGAYSPLDELKIAVNRLCGKQVFNIPTFNMQRDVLSQEEDLMLHELRARDGARTRAVLWRQQLLTRFQDSQAQKISQWILQPWEQLKPVLEGRPMSIDQGRIDILVCLQCHIAQTPLGRRDSNDLLIGNPTLVGQVDVESNLLPGALRLRGVRTVTITEEGGAKNNMDYYIKPELQDGYTMQVFMNEQGDGGKRESVVDKSDPDRYNPYLGHAIPENGIIAIQDQFGKVVLRYAVKDYSQLIQVPVVVN